MVIIIYLCVRRPFCCVPKVVARSNNRVPIRGSQVSCFACLQTYVRADFINIDVYVLIICICTGYYNLFVCSQTFLLCLKLWPEPFCCVPKVVARSNNRVPFTPSTPSELFCMFNIDVYVLIICIYNAYYNLFVCSQYA